MRSLWLVLAVACGSHAVRPSGQQPARILPPPIAERHPHQVASPNGSREDPYYWMRDDARKDPAVLGYLRAENAYASATLAPVAKLEKALVAELRSHIREDDVEAPVLADGYWYTTHYKAGQEQPVLVRRKDTLHARDEVILDGNELARAHEYFEVTGSVVSHDGRYLAWCDDVVGRRQYVLHIKDLTTGKVLADTATNVSPSLAWANDNRTLFYIGKDPTTLRQDRVFRHALGTARDPLVFKDDDGSFYVSVAPTKSRRYVVIMLEATTSSEVRLVDADHPDTAPRVLLPRQRDHLYYADHIDGHFVIRTNAGAKNFRLIEVADGKEADRAQWHDVIAARDDQLIEGFAVYHTLVAASVRTGGLGKVLAIPGGGAPFYVDSEEPASMMTVVDTPMADATRLRYRYTSMVTPPSIYELDTATRAKTLIKRTQVPGYDPTKYATEYLHAPATDGATIPISVVYRKDTKRTAAPLLVYGYGSYGSTVDPEFDGDRLPLLDRGWVYAIAHIRGGEDLGRAWYEDGKLLHKMNTFTDFIAATEYLIANQYGARDQVYAQGYSAGGLLMAAVMNLRPELYRGVIAGVPFVDVVTTMLDETIPLTTNEFDEWGNPKEKRAYEYMLGYSPYDNVRAQAYPSIYVKTTLWDSQVQYYEPAKWVAKLRATKTDDNLIVFDVDTAGGHEGKSGRFDRLKDVAREYAFLLMVHDRRDGRPRWPAN